MGKTFDMPPPASGLCRRTAHPGAAVAPYMRLRPRIHGVDCARRYARMALHVSITAALSTMSCEKGSDAVHHVFAGENL